MDISLQTGLLYSIVGFTIVFLVLCLLAVLIWLMGLYFKKQDAKKALSEQENIQPQVELVVDTDENFNPDTELVAVIMASITAMSGNSNFVIKKIKPSSEWRRSAKYHR